MGNTSIKEQTECRVCKGILETVLDLGMIYPSGFVPKDFIPDEDSKAPLELAKCTECGLVQLKHTIDLDLMYRQYWYSSSLNKSMVTSLKEVVNDVETKIILYQNDIVVDIGCNDGTMLELYSEPELEKIGFDPALNLVRKSLHRFRFCNNYFSIDEYPAVNKAKVVTAIAMYYDLPDPIKFTQDVASILHEDGIFVVQFTDLLSMFKLTAFDNICHEHLEYYTVKNVKNILETCGLEIIDISYNNVNGGSVRITSAHKSRYEVSSRTWDYLEDEEDYLRVYGFTEFKRAIDVAKTKVKSFIKWAKDKNSIVHLLGASTKGNTFLQIMGITAEDIPYAAEVNSDKFGLKTLGSDIEIISETDSLIKHPDYYLVPVWHFKENILRNPKIRDYMLAGGSLIFPLPEYTVITLDYNKNVKETRI